MNHDPRRIEKTERTTDQSILRYGCRQQGDSGTERVSYQQGYAHGMHFWRLELCNNKSQTIMSISIATRANDQLNTKKLGETTNAVELDTELDAMVKRTSASSPILSHMKLMAQCSSLLRSNQETY